jgi:uncharacterized protein (DUF1697 family)
MTTYIALLRSINVSGHNKIKMVELKRMCELLAFHHVKTFIQSGNVVFASDKTADLIQAEIETALHTTFGIKTEVMIRSLDEWNRLIQNCPYVDVSLGKEDSIHVSILKNPLPAKMLVQLEQTESEQDEYYLGVNAIYFLFQQRISESKLAKNIQKLGKSATTRNWNTIMKLQKLAQDVQNDHIKI